MWGHCMPPGWPHHQGVALSWGRIFLPLLFLLVTARSRVDGEDGEATPILLSRATTLLRVRDTIMVLEGCFYGQSPRIELKRRVFVGLFIPKILLWKQYCDSKLTLLTDDSGFRTSFYQMPINLHWWCQLYFHHSDGCREHGNLALSHRASRISYGLLDTAGLHPHNYHLAQHGFWMGKLWGSPPTMAGQTDGYSAPIIYKPFSSLSFSKF